jgi:hypothetical protein
MLAIPPIPRTTGPGIPTSAASLAAFACAASTKYPWIHRWTVWNEPNLQLFLRPNSPALYVSHLLNPAYRALKEADPGGFLRRVVVAGRAAKLRLWSPRDRRYGTVLTVS